MGSYDCIDKPLDGEDRRNESPLIFDRQTTCILKSRFRHLCHFFFSTTTDETTMTAPPMMAAIK